MKVWINKSNASGICISQPSKSYAHRLLIASCLSFDECRVENIVLSNDILATINCIKTLGKEVVVEGEAIKTLIIKNDKSFNIDNIDELIFDCNESGSTLRFFIPIALTLGKKAIFKGTKRLIERGIKIYEDICAKQNIEIIKQDQSITFIGKLHSDIFEVDGSISSQFITGLLFALPLLEGKSTIKVVSKLESKNYIDITIDVLNKAGINIEVKDNVYTIENQKYNANVYKTEGDYSNSAFIECFNYLGGKVTIEGLNDLSVQGDKKYLEILPMLDKGYCTVDISNCIDLGPILFCFAALKHGACFTGVSRLKIKESDRIDAVRQELNKFGVEVIERDNKVFINNENIHKPKDILYGQNDHRIVMALSVMLTVYGGCINGYEAINKSYPSFFDDLEKLGIEVKYDFE